MSEEFLFWGWAVVTVWSGWDWWDGRAARPFHPVAVQWWRRAQLAKGWLAVLALVNLAGAAVRLWA